jgi:hypothetical protein
MCRKKIKKIKNYENCSFCIKNGYFGCISCSKKPIYDYDDTLEKIKKFKIIKMKKITKLKNSHFHQYLYLIKHKNKYKFIYDVHILYSKCYLCKCCYTNIKNHYSKNSHKKYTDLHDIKKSYYINSIIDTNIDDEFIAIQFFNTINKSTFKDLQDDIKKSLNTNCKTIKNTITIEFYEFCEKILNLFNKFKKKYNKEYPKKIKEAYNLLYNKLPKDLCNYIMEWC